MATLNTRQAIGGRLVVTNFDFAEGQTITHSGEFQSDFPQNLPISKATRLPAQAMPMAWIGVAPAICSSAA